MHQPKGVYGYVSFGIENPVRSIVSLTPYLPC